MERWVEYGNQSLSSAWLSWPWIIFCSLVLCEMLQFFLLGMGVAHVLGGGRSSWSGLFRLSLLGLLGTSSLKYPWQWMISFLSVSQLTQCKCVKVRENPEYLCMCMCVTSTRAGVWRPHSDVQQLHHHTPQFSSLGSLPMDPSACLLSSRITGGQHTHLT